MARRGGELTRLMKTASTWPWRVSAALVPVSFGVCHVIALATAHTAAPVNPRGLGSVVLQQGIHFLATLLQYVLPAIFLVAVISSVWSGFLARIPIWRTRYA